MTAAIAVGLVFGLVMIYQLSQRDRLARRVAAWLNAYADSVVVRRRALNWWMARAMEDYSRPTEAPKA